MSRSSFPILQANGEPSVSFAETRRRLSEATERFDGYRREIAAAEADRRDRIESLAGRAADAVGSMGASGFGTATALLEESERRLESIDDPDREDGLREAVAEPIAEYLDVVREGGDVLSTIDLPAVPGAVDFDRLPDAIDTEAIGRGELNRSVRPVEALSAIDLLEVPNVVDIPAFLKEKRELDVELDDIRRKVPDEEGTGILGDVADSIRFDSTGGDGFDLPPEVLQTVLPSKLDDSIGRFRERLLEAHERLGDSSERVREQVGSIDQPTSRNPSAHSTLTVGRGIVRGAPTFSVVPRRVRHSVTKGRERLYGARLEQAADEE